VPAARSDSGQGAIAAVATSITLDLKPKIVLLNGTFRQALPASGSAKDIV
jgi:hypothetical protein